jgi:hypothetical protein
MTSSNREKPDIESGYDGSSDEDSTENSRAVSCFFRFSVILFVFYKGF